MEKSIKPRSRTRAAQTGTHILCPEPPRLPPRDALPDSPISLEEAIREAGTDGKLRGLRFRGAALTEQELHGFDVEGCLFQECRFTGQEWEGVHFSDTRFEQCDLSGFRLQDCGLRRVEFRQCRMLGFWSLEGIWEHVFLTGCAAQYGNYGLSQFRRCLLEDCDFSSGTFGGADFRNTAIRRCRFDQTEFFHAKLAGLDFSDSSLSGAAFALEDLRKVTVSPEQAVELAKLLGLYIKS